MSRIGTELSWESGVLIFDAIPVQDIVQQFNRHYRHPRIEVRDGRIGTSKMSGVFKSLDPKSFISALQRIEPRMRARQSDGPQGDILLGRPSISCSN
jgi:ferric-dicitrate binding protein FerR (iron transport regulator)